MRNIETPDGTWENTWATDPQVKAAEIKEGHADLTMHLDELYGADADTTNLDQVAHVIAGCKINIDANTLLAEKDAWRRSAHMVRQWALTHWSVAEVDAAEAEQYA